MSSQAQTIDKGDVRAEIREDRNAYRKYQDFFVGNRRLGSLIRYELAHLLASPIPGAVGYVLRKLLMVPLLKNAGSGVQVGRDVTFRHPGKISVGDQTAIDDLCVLDARGVEEGKFNIGAEVLIARGTAITAKTDHGVVRIGDHCTIGKNCILSSSGGIRIGKWVGIAGDCYIGGGRYGTDRTDVPMMEQELYTKGPVVIEDDCTIGAGARVLDGVTIGQGSVIGAGAVVREDVPESTMVAPRQELVQMPRSAKNATGSDESPDDSSPGDSRERGGESRQSVRDSIYRAIDTLNRTRSAEEHLEKSPETPLVSLESIEKVNLIIETEAEIEKEIGKSINLVDNIGGEEDGTNGRDIFKTVDDFSDYVESQVES